MKKQCTYQNCERKQYAKGLCRTHYVQVNVFKRKPAPIRYYGEPGCCSVGSCHNTAVTKGLCPMHYQRWRKYGSVNKKYKAGVKRTTGTGQEYPNHALLKRNRLIKLKMNPICEYCHEKKSKITHHRDGKKIDHSIPNLMAVCGQSCHKKVHNELFTKQHICRDKAPINSLVPAMLTRREVSFIFLMDQLSSRRPHERIEISAEKNI